MESSWFTTKKRGRDDDKIEEDKVLARQARSRRKPAATNRKMKKQIPQCNSDGDSLDDFIVEDDVLSEDENVSSNKSSDDDDDLDSYLGLSGKRRVSRPPNPPKRKFGQKMPDKRARAPKLKGKKMKPMLKNHSSSTIDLCSSSDSEFDEPSKKTSKTFQRKVSESDSRGQQSHDSIFSDDDGDDETGILAYRKGGEPAAIPSVAAASNKEECEDEGSPFPSLKARRGKPKRFAIMDDKSEDGGFGGDCLVDSPSPLKKMSRKKSQFARKQQPASKTSGRNPALNDDLSDDDALALALALSKSEKEAGKMPGLDSASDGDNKVDVELLDTSDEEDGDEEDAYSDPAAKEASSVLDKANALSAQILSTLTKWSASVETSVAPELGMISNGAITLSTTVADRSHDHTWISKELMSEICPSVTLADYQLIGVNWIALLHGLKSETEGSKSYTNVNGILADEMGLGKTVQTIAFLSWLKYSNGLPASISEGSPTSRPHLVIAPASVLSNWEREFEKFAPDLKVLKYHGSMAERTQLQEELRIHLPDRAAQRRTLRVDPLDVILAPITYFQKEKSDDRSFLRKFRYSYLVVDEAHILKNPRGIRYKSLDRLSSEHRLLLTGTPVQNSPKELLSLLCFLMPLFSSKNLGDSYDDETSNDGGESMLRHFVALEGSPSSDEAAYSKLKQLFAPFVLRRRKVDVLSQVMPPKTQRVEFVKLDSAARALYDSILSNHIQAKRTNDNTSGGHLFTALRKASHHPLLLRSRHMSESEKEHLADCFYKYGAFRGEGCTKPKVANELEKYNDFQIHLAALELIEENPLRRNDLERYILPEDSLFSSAKFVRLRQLLPQLIKDGHRILIFSVWTSCLDLLSCLLESMSLEYLRMEGSTPVSERQSLIDQFNSTSIPVFLLSTKACGLGINLTSADTCIFHDLDFNPMNDKQAEDRCHRIGQRSKVTIYRLVAQDCVDQDIHEMQERKAKMSELIMATKGSDNQSWKTEEAKEKSIVLETAVNRFLKSPQIARGDRKENAQNIERDDI